MPRKKAKEGFESFSMVQKLHNSNESICFGILPIASLPIKTPNEAVAWFIEEYEN